MPSIGSTIRTDARRGDRRREAPREIASSRKAARRRSTISALASRSAMVTGSSALRSTMGFRRSPERLARRPRRFDRDLDLLHRSLVLRGFLHFAPRPDGESSLYETRSMHFDLANILVFLVMGGVIVFATLALGKLIRPAVEGAQLGSTSAVSTDPSAWFSFNPRFYIVALVFLVFDVEVAFTARSAWSTALGRRGCARSPSSDLPFVAILMLSSPALEARRPRIRPFVRAEEPQRDQDDAEGHLRAPDEVSRRDLGLHRRRGRQGCLLQGRRRAHRRDHDVPARRSAEPL